MIIENSIDNLIIFFNFLFILYQYLYNINEKKIVNFDHDNDLLIDNLIILFSILYIISNNNYLRRELTIIDNLITVFLLITLYINTYITYKQNFVNFDHDLLIDSYIDNLINNIIFFFIDSY